MQLILLRLPGFDAAIVESDEMKTENWNFLGLSALRFSN